MTVSNQAWSEMWVLTQLFLIFVPVPNFSTQGPSCESSWASKTLEGAIAIHKHGNKLVRIPEVYLCNTPDLQTKIPNRILQYTERTIPHIQVRLLLAIQVEFSIHESINLTHCKNRISWVFFYCYKAFGRNNIRERYRFWLMVSREFQSIKREKYDGVTPMIWEYVTDDFTWQLDQEAKR